MTDVSGQKSDFEVLCEWAQLRSHFDLAWRLFNVNLALVSPEGERSVCFDRSSRTAPFCMAIHSRSGGQKLCEECDRRFLRQAVRQLGALRYQCHVGLTEFIVPVIRHGRVIALLQCGQVFDADPSDEQLIPFRTAPPQSPPGPNLLDGDSVHNRVLAPSRQDDLVLFLKMIADSMAHLEIFAYTEPVQQSHKVLRKALAYVEANLEGPLPNKEIARAAGVSTRSLSRIFRNDLDMSVLAFVNDRRIARACHYLASTDRSCIEVAFGVGFQSIQNFNRIFRRIKKTTPRDWRREIARQHHEADLPDPNQQSGKFAVGN